MTRSLRTGLLCLSLLPLAGCFTPTVVMTCPPIPAALTEACPVTDRQIATNGDLADAYLEARGCLREERLKLAAIKALADCRTQR